MLEANSWIYSAERVALTGLIMRPCSLLDCSRWTPSRAATSWLFQKEHPVERVADVVLSMDRWLCRLPTSNLR